MNDMSRNIRDDLVNILSQSDPTQIRSVYSEINAFYLLYFPEFERIYCFDKRGALQDGSSRVTMWDQQHQSNMFRVGTDIMFTREDGLGKYAGYTDNGTAYVMKYFTNYFDFDDPSKLKILKRLTTTVIGGNNQSLTLKAGFDYFNSYRSYPATLANLSNYEYGIAEYGLAEFSTGTLVDQIRAPMGGDGNVIQMGIEATINGEELSIQRLDVFVKEGRIL